MSAAVAVPSLMMMTSMVSEESLARDRYTDTGLALKFSRLLSTLKTIKPPRAICPHSKTVGRANEMWRHSVQV